MTNAPRDNNSIPVALGTSNADGATPLPFYVNPSTHAMSIDDDVTGSDLSGDIAARDDNGEAVLLGVSSADGSTPTPIYVDSSTKKLLAKST